MKHKIILHIGHGKTGSSYLQSFLALNSEILAKNGVRYPFDNSFEDAKLGRISSGNSDVLESTVELLKLTKISNTTLFSGENLFMELLKKNHLMTELQRNDLHVIMYSRNLFDYLISAWGQYIKRGAGTLGINDFLMEDIDHVYPYILKWIKKSRINKFQLTIKNYSLEKENILHDFMASIFPNLKVAEFEYSLPPLRFVNRSLSLVEYEFQTEFNKYFSNSSKYISDMLVNNLPETSSETPYVNEKVYEHVKKKFAPLLAEINKHLPTKSILICEPYEELKKRFTANQIDKYLISSDQIKIMVKSISEWINAVTNRELSDFNPEIYLKLNPDVKAAGVDPCEHFIRFGIQEGRRFK
jgi:hypothetical protein